MLSTALSVTCTPTIINVQMARWSFAMTTLLTSLPCPLSLTTSMKPAKQTSWQLHHLTSGRSRRDPELDDGSSAVNPERTVTRDTSTAAPPCAGRQDGALLPPDL